MYIDLSIRYTSAIDTNYLLKKLPQESYNQAAINYQFADTIVNKVPESFSNLNMGSMKLYSRATLTIEQTNTLHQLSQTQNQFDLMAVKPKSQKMFHTLCVEYDNYDIISFDLGAKLPFMLKRNPVQQALRKGKYFEINYSPMFDEGSKVPCMTNIINIIKATGGKNLIITSNADNFKYHRTPFDIASLMITLGMNKNDVLRALKDTPQNVLKASLHRKYFKGTIKEISDVVVKKLGKKISKHREKLMALKKVVK